MILFKDMRDFGWTLAGPAMLAGGLAIAVEVGAMFPLVLGLASGGIAVLVTLVTTIRNNGILLAAPMFVVKVVLAALVVALVLLAFGAVPVEEKRWRMAVIPSMLAVGALALFVNGPRVAARRQARLRVQCALPVR